MFKPFQNQKLRTFYANDWKQAESLKLKKSSLKSLKYHQIFSLMRKNCVKISIHRIKQNQLAMNRTARSNGILILFPIFPNYFKI